MDILADSADPDEMLQNAAFHQDLDRMLRYMHSSGIGIHYNLKLLTLDPLLCTMNYSKIISSNQIPLHQLTQFYLVKRAKLQKL